MNTPEPARFLVHARTGVLHATACTRAAAEPARTELHETDARALAAARAVTVCCRCAAHLLPAPAPLSADDDALVATLVDEWVASGAAPDPDGLGTYWVDSLDTLAADAVRTIREQVTSV